MAFGNTARVGNSSRGLAAGGRGRRGKGGISGAYDLYNTAVRQQAGDYDKIQSGYGDFLKSAKGGVENLGELARTGGYSEADKANLRARGTSPIRAVYAGADREIDRSRRLSGGSAGYGALKARMAREQSQATSDATQNVEAGIAQNVASNRISAGGQFASMTPQALSGATSIYGTTPALANTFGNQAIQGASLQNNIRQNNLNRSLSLPSRGRSRGVSRGMGVNQGRGYYG